MIEFRGVTKRFPDGTVAVTVSGDADDPWDSYAVVYADPANRLPVGRSGTQPRW